MSSSHHPIAYVRLAALAIAAIAASIAPVAHGAESAVGQRIPDAELQDATGAAVLLSDFREARFTVLVFVGAGCPISQQYLPVLNELQQEFGERHVQFVGVDAARADSLEDIAAHVEEYDIRFPVLRDPEGRLARTLGVERLTETFVVDSQFFVRYHGRIDDRIGYDHKRSEPRRRDLAEALTDLLGGDSVRVDRTEAAGCLITLPSSATNVPEDVDFAQHVAPIVQAKCQNCHHAGTAAPFELATHDDYVNWSQMIREVVEQRRMPPWHADPRYGAFSNDRRLTNEELDTLVAWLDADCPPGDESLAPEPTEYAEGWTIGEPDLVFELPEEVAIPATGEVPYQYFTTDLGFDEDVYITAAEAMPGNRRAVHHIIAFYVPPGEKLSENAGLDGQWICGTAPGDMPLVLPEGVALKVPAGSKLLWQMHYTPTGKPEQDRSRIGIVKYRGDEPPRRLVHMVAPAQTRLRIPAGEHHHEVAARTLYAPRDMILLSFMPHMHLRGKSFRYVAEIDGEEQILLSTPRYDFNWQSTYRLAEPFLLPQGSKLRCEAVFDNSADNPANPDPTQDVRWGDQTWEEMMIGYVNYVWAEPEQLAAGDARRQAAVQ